MKTNPKLFAHTADLHIGASANRIPDYLERQKKAILDIYRKCKKRECGIVVIAGDTLHKHQPTRDERDLLLEVVLQMDDKGFITIIMEGNHDREDFEFTNIHFLSILEQKGRLKNTFIIENYPKLIKIKKFNFLAIPKGNTDPNIIIKEHKDIKNLVPIIHDTIKYSKYDSGHVTKSGLVLGNHKNVLYYPLGHYHTKQKVGDVARYCGSPLQHDFGEKGKKGFYIVNRKKPESPKFIKIKSKRLIEVTDMKDAPKNAWVRLISNDATIDLPDNIIDVAAHKEDYTPIQVNTDDITENLPAFLAAEGLDDSEQMEAVKYIKSLTEAL